MAALGALCASSVSMRTASSGAVSAIEPVDEIVA